MSSTQFVFAEVPDATTKLQAAKMHLLLAARVANGDQPDTVSVDGLTHGDFALLIHLLCKMHDMSDAQLNALDYDPDGDVFRG